MKTSSKIAFIIAWFIAMIIGFVILAEVTHAKELPPISISTDIYNDCYQVKTDAIACYVWLGDKNDVGHIYISYKIDPKELRRVIFHELYHYFDRETTREEYMRIFHLPETYTIAEMKEHVADAFSSWINKSQLVENWYGDYFRNKIK